MPDLSTRCPYCSSRMQVRTLFCPGCKTEVTSDFLPSALFALSRTEQDFVVRFVLASGSLKEMASVLGVSYPTVRSRLDRLIEKLRGTRLAPREKRAAILDAIEERELSPKEAADLLKRLTAADDDPGE